MIYGAGIQNKHIFINGKNEDSGIYKTIGKEASNNVHKDELWNNFVSNKIVLDLHSEIDTAYKIIKESWIESGAGKGRRMKNMSNKTTAVFIETENGDMRTKSKGKLLSHFLQGIEARILWGIMNEERDSFVMPHHDGWVSFNNWDTDILEKIIKGSFPIGEKLPACRTIAKGIGSNLSTVNRAIQKMAEKNVGALLVMHEDKVAGIISERDYTRKLILKNRSSKDTPVADVMTKDVGYVTQQEQVNECMALMTEKRIRHLPVIEDGKVLGVISLGDVVKTIIDEQDHEIQDYEQYIRGWY